MAYHSEFGRLLLFFALFDFFVHFFVFVNFCFWLLQDFS